MLPMLTVQLSDVLWWILEPKLQISQRIKITVLQRLKPTF